MPKVFMHLHIHAVLIVKNRQAYLSPIIKKQLEQYITMKSAELKSPVLAIGGFTDHLHILFRLDSSVCMSAWARTLKSSSTIWIHNRFLELHDFSWQSGYGAFSVSFENITRVAGYIHKQESHHRNNSSYSEWVEMLAYHNDVPDTQS